MPKVIEPVNSVGQQATNFCKLAVRIDGRKTIASRERRKLRAVVVKERIRHNDKTAVRLAPLCGNG
jgi:hypothetical protein